MLGKIYGISSKYDFDCCSHIVYVFNTPEEANAWIHMEESDYRQRELMPRKSAIKVAGRKAVNAARAFINA